MKTPLRQLTLLKNVRRPREDGNNVNSLERNAHPSERNAYPLERNPQLLAKDCKHLERKEGKNGDWLWVSSALDSTAYQ